MWPHPAILAPKIRSNLPKFVLQPYFPTKHPTIFPSILAVGIRVNVRFIFAGSKYHLMAEMFSSPQRPFYQSTQKMDLREIPVDKYYAFAVKHLEPRGIVVDEPAFRYVYDMLSGHTWYVQRVLNKIYETCEGHVAMPEIDAIVQEIIGEEEFDFQRQYSLLTSNQQRLVKAIAIEQRVDAPNAKAFVQKHALGAVSSINRALEYLCDNEFVLRQEGAYSVYDRFFALWLRRPLARLPLRR